MKTFQQILDMFVSQLCHLFGCQGVVSAVANLQFSCLKRACGLRFVF